MPEVNFSWGNPLNGCITQARHRGRGESSLVAAEIGDLDQFHVATAGKAAWSDFPEPPKGLVLGMVRTDAEESEQQLLASRVLASTVRLDGHKDGINIF